MQPYFLGIDGGGTKTAAVVIDASGRVCGSGEGGPCNVAGISDERLMQSVRETTHRACAAAGLDTTTHFAGICAGVAGFSVEQRRNVFGTILRDTLSSDCYRIEPDYMVAYWGATRGMPGIVVIAGTGAVSFGRNAEGETYREDGLGYLLGDRGSGFNLGLRVLRHTLALMQEGKSDLLTQTVLAYTGARSQNEIVQWLYGNFSPSRVAAMAPLVGELAEQGDAPARDHVAAMAQRLRHAVRQVRHKLWLPWDASVYTLGGLWNIGPFFRAEFADPHWRFETGNLDNDALPGGQFNICVPLHDAAYGAALLAKEE